jgi:ribonuclease HI
VYESLRYARELGFHVVELNVDSLVVANVLSKKGSVIIVGGSLVLKIHRLIKLKWKVVPKHFFCEVNQCANALRNIRCSMMTDINFYELCPAQFSHLISAVIKKIGYDSLINWN